MLGKKLAGNRYRAIQRLHYTYFLLSYCFLFGGIYMTEDRDLSFDAFRGLAIIAVIAIHTIDTVFPWKSTAMGGWSLFFVVTYRQLLNFAVPAFIFISGYWLSKKPINSLEDYKVFLMKRFSRVLIPYFFWSVILLGYAAIREHKFDIYQMIFKLLTGRATTIYFFIMVISQLYIITPLLHYINRKRYGLMLVLILNVISLLSAYLSRLYFNYWIPVSSAFYSWIIFYEIGLLVGSSHYKVFAAKKVQLFILPAILVCLLISGLEASILLSKYDNLSARYFAVAPVKYSSFLYSVCIIIAFLHIRKRLSPRPKFLAALGYYSFGIYLIHIPILNQVANLIQKSSTIYSFQSLYQLTVVLITIAICFILIDVARKLLPESFCRKVLGF
jgi:surface polysaccharide O-acyltransferase-like enzyme